MTLAVRMLDNMSLDRGNEMRQHDKAVKMWGVETVRRFDEISEEAQHKAIDNQFERKLQDCRARRKAAILRASRLVQQEG